MFGSSISNFKHPVGSGDVTHFIGIQSDVSKRRRAEDELRRTTRELESALGELREQWKVLRTVNCSTAHESNAVLAINAIFAALDEESN